MCQWEHGIADRGHGKATDIQHAQSLLPQGRPDRIGNLSDGCIALELIKGEGQ
jgi:hypothetical protein